MREIIDGVAQADDAFDYYQKLIVSRAKRKDGSGLGLARICAEGEMKITYALEGDLAIIEATTYMEGKR